MILQRAIRCFFVRKVPNKYPKNDKVQQEPLFEQLVALFELFPSIQLFFQIRRSTNSLRYAATKQQDLASSITS